MNSRKGRISGTSCIEILIVIVIIAILALIFISKAERAGIRARESVLHGNLSALRNAIQQFKADCGRYPTKLDELMTKPADIPGLPKWDSPTPGTHQWQGPYLKTPDGKLPKDPFTGRADWTYDPTACVVHSRSQLTSSNGDKYYSW